MLLTKAVKELSPEESRQMMRRYPGRILGSRMVRRWKPAPEPYLHACRALDTDPAATWMVAAHAWDLAGARSVGMKTAWLSRLEGEFDANFGAPDVSGRDMGDVIDRLVAD